MQYQIPGQLYLLRTKDSGYKAMRQAGDLTDVEITPAMIEAGARLIRTYDSRFEDEESLAESIFVEMVRTAGDPAASRQGRVAGDAG